MPYTGTLNASILIQDAAGGQVASKAVTDQLTAQEEYQVLEVTVAAAASEQAVDIAPYKPTMIMVITDQPVVMKLATSGTEIPVRKLAVITAPDDAAIASLLFDGHATEDAQVYVALTSVN